jgi:hypothetical protein
LLTILVKNYFIGNRNLPNNILFEANSVFVIVI